MNKRLLALLLAMTLLLALSACGGKQGGAEDKVEEENVGKVEDEVESTGNEAAADAAGDGAEDENMDGAEDLLTDPEEQPESGSRPAGTTQKPESKPVQKPAELPAEKPADGQSKPAPKADLAAFYETLSAGEDWPAMMLAEGEILDAFYPDLSGIAANQCVVYTAMISASVGEIALVEVQNADDIQKVKDIFQARVDYQVGDDENPGGAWYPQTIEGWKNGSRIVSNGNFVMLVALSEGADGVVDSFNALFT